MLIKIALKLNNLITKIQKKLGRLDKFIHTSINLGNSCMYVKLRDKKLRLDNLPNLFLMEKGAAYSFLTWDRHPLSGMTLQIAPRQSLYDCVTISDNAAKSHKEKTIEANFSARKITLNDDVVSAIEKLYFQFQRPIRTRRPQLKCFLLPLACKALKRRILSAGSHIDVQLYDLTQMQRF